MRGDVGTAAPADQVARATRAMPAKYHIPPASRDSIH